MIYRSARPFPSDCMSLSLQTKLAQQCARDLQERQGNDDAPSPHGD